MKLLHMQIAQCRDCPHWEMDNDIEVECGYCRKVEKYTDRQGYLIATWCPLPDADEKEATK